MLGIPSTLISVFAIVALLVVIIFLAGCTTIGKGSATLIPAKPDKNLTEFTKFYPDLVSDTPAMRQLTPEATTDTEKYARYLQNKLGCKNCKTSEMSIVVRDRTKTPPFLPVDINIEKELLGLYLNKDLTSEQKEKLESIAKGKIFNVPDLPGRTTIHDQIEGKGKRFFYYPRIQIDFASRLRSPSHLDRFAYLGMAVQIKNTLSSQEKNNESSENESKCSMARFIDFHPKAADIIEFTRGQLTQKAELAAKTNLSRQDIDKITGGTSAGADTDKTTTGSEQSSSKTVSPELSLSMSETFVNALKESIEARTAGILQQGQAFFVDYRAIKSKRIGGTYNFDMMLEVPATIEDIDGNDSIYLSQPCVKDIRADVYMVAVVRHVYDRGYTGWFNRVPEPDNDKAYYQVITELVPDVQLWKYDGSPWVKQKTTRPIEFVVSVTTNRDDAKYVIRSEGTGSKILGRGSGSASQITVTPATDQDIKAHIEFLDVIQVENGKALVFTAPHSETFAIEKKTSGEQSVLGNYSPK